MTLLHIHKNIKCSKRAQVFLPTTALIFTKTDYPRGRTDITAAQACEQCISEYSTTHHTISGE